MIAALQPHGEPPPRERPMLFSGTMVRAVLAGRKTQTRRILRQPKRKDGAKLLPELLQLIGGVGHACPHGAAGDRLWVRETWKRNSGGFIRYEADGVELKHDRQEAFGLDHVNRPSIHMPRWASRLTLEVTGVRVERVQDITEEDIRAEGVDSAVACSLLWKGHGSGEGLRRIGCLDLFEAKPNTTDWTPRDCWRVAWQAINGERAPWSGNPWTWAISFSPQSQRESA